VTGEHSNAITSGTPDAARAPDSVLSPELADAIEKAMQLEPGARWQSAGEFAVTLRVVATLLEERADAISSAPEAAAPPQAESGGELPAAVSGGEPVPQVVPESSDVAALTDSSIVAVGVDSDSELPAPMETDTLSPATPGGIRGLLGGLFRSRRSKTQNA
jgi:hypothetical protein